MSSMIEHLSNLHKCRGMLVLQVVTNASTAQKGMKVAFAVRICFHGQPCLQYILALSCGSGQMLFATETQTAWSLSSTLHRFFTLAAAIWSVMETSISQSKNISRALLVQGHGCTLFGSGTLIESTKVRGVDSDGMLCSAYGLGWAEEEDSVLVELPSDAVVGSACSSTPLQVCMTHQRTQPPVWSHWWLIS